MLKLVADILRGSHKLVLRYYYIRPKSIINRRIRVTIPSSVPGLASIGQGTNKMVTRTVNFTVFQSHSFLYIQTKKNDLFRSKPLYSIYPRNIIYYNILPPFSFAIPQFTIIIERYKSDRINVMSSSHKNCLEEYYIQCMFWECYKTVYRISNYYEYLRLYDSSVLKSMWS